jgi:hypothetical protein
MSRRKAPLPGQGGRGSRERQSVWCCRVHYARWRFVGKDFPGTHHTHCFRCGKELRWPAKRRVVQLPLKQKLERRQATFRAAYQRRAGKFLDAGMTAHGALPKSPLTPKEQAWRELRASMGDLTVPSPSSSSLRYE